MQLRFQVVQPFRLGVQKIDDLLVGADGDRLGVGLSGDLAAQLAEQAVCGGGHGLDAARSLAVFAGRAQLLLQALARAFARHLHQAEFADLADVAARLVFLQRGAQRVGDFGAVGRALHVDEIDDDEAADVAQAELFDHDLGGLQVGLQHGLFLAALAHEAAGVDVDGGQRLGPVDDDVAAGFERHAPVERLGDLGFDLVVVEDGRRQIVQLHPAGQSRHEGRDELVDAFVVAGVVDDDLVHVGGEHVADDAQHHVHVVVDERRRTARLALLGDPAPQSEQEFHVVLNLFLRQSLAGGADDEAALRRSDALHGFAQASALLAVRNPPGDADVAHGRGVHELASGQGQVRGQPRPFGPDRVLGHLDEDFLVLLELVFERGVRFGPAAPAGAAAPRCGSGVAVGLAVGQVEVAQQVAVVETVTRRQRPVEHVRGMDEAGFSEPDVDERGLHAGHDAHDAPEIDVAGDVALLGAFDVDFDQGVVFEQRNASFLGR